jgi:hypothetical protein
MPAKISMKPITQTFKLSIDDAGETTVTIRQARTGDVIHIGNLFSKQTRVWDDAEFGTVKLQQDWNYEELKRERAFRVMVGCDLIAEESDNPIFRFREGKTGSELAMSQNDFYRAWDALPSEITTEIHQYIQIVNPQWDPNSGE